MKATRKGKIIGGATVAGTLAVLITNPILQLVQDSQDSSLPLGISQSSTGQRSTRTTSVAEQNLPVNQDVAQSPVQNPPRSNSGAAASQGKPYESSAENKYGTTRVRAWVNNGKLANIEILDVPTDHKSQRINSRAMPTLIEEALQAQSADVHGISGATYTSQAFKESLQAALDQAGVVSHNASK
ncbi:FMN-binding protein [Arcanobacterium ihumii]|uniref:FMN-binding protein n=1 Tax=Arcanobacterium ihumii TaxID=2138162 RepID=UPI000F53C4C7|nr:FMN-binding protein [Arcanobacterium ihumii]